MKLNTEAVSYYHAYLGNKYLPNNEIPTAKKTDYGHAVEYMSWKQMPNKMFTRFDIVCIVLSIVFYILAFTYEIGFILFALICNVSFVIHLLITIVNFSETKKNIETSIIHSGMLTLGIVSAIEIMQNKNYIYVQYHTSFHTLHTIRIVQHIKKDPLELFSKTETILPIFVHPENHEQYIISGLDRYNKKKNYSTVISILEGVFLISTLKN